ncbi:MAG: flagellar hook protein FlgE [Cognatishimia sp.]|uniref:flagellar hook protein FlgE n=1 Tax=Cognatishimia sp. TaxID=2211648 RepID=UPI003B8E3F4C
MSISSALQTGVSGLQANSTAVGGISENIANANTVGYRRGFAHMVTTTAGGGTGNGVLSVVAEDQLDINRAGGLISTTSATDLAIGGNGFFIVSANPNETVQTNYHLTRAGSFLPDEDGNLRNAAGFYLSGFPYDATGNLGTVDRSSFGSMETVNIGNVTLSAAQTSEMSILGNLPAQDTGLATPGAPFETSSELFTGLGETQRISFSWQPTATENQWTVTMADHEGTDLGSVTVDFNDSGALAGSPSAYSGAASVATAPSAFAFDTATGQATITLNNGTTPQTITIDLGEPGSFNGVTQFAGDFSQSFERDGSSVGELIRTEIDEAGTLYGVFDNGMRRALYEIPVGVVDNPNGLIEEKGNAYSLTAETGGFFAQQANSGSTGSINSGALEGSNVDIAQEMTDLIRVQRAFSTNAKVITTVDDMMDETTRLKR